MDLSVVDLTSELIRCHPVYRSPGVGKALDIAAEQLRGLGLDCDVHPYDGGHQLLAGHVFSPDGPHVVVNGHIDIENGGQALPGPRHDDAHPDRIYGAGASDMLGGIAALIATVRDLLRRDDLTGRITLQIVIGRHLGGASTRALFEEAALPRADLAIIAEPTNRHVCTTAYGFACYRLRSVGSPGPMAYATDRKNAGTHAATALLALDSANHRLQELYPTHQRIRYVLPGVIRAGTEAATPAAEALVEFAMALPPLLPEDTALKVVDTTIRSRFSAAGLPLPTWEPYGPKFPATSLGHTSFSNLLREVDPGLRWCQYPCPSDARAFQDLGIPMVLYGPGDLARTRQPGEYIEAGELHRYVRTLSTALARWLARGGG